MATARLFTGPTAPRAEQSPAPGDLWSNPAPPALSVYDGAAWVPLTFTNDERLRNARPPAAHVHDRQDVAGLVGELASKADRGHTHPGPPA